MRGYFTRLAVFEDVPELMILIGNSVRSLSSPYYTEKQMESAIRYVFGVDTQLLLDGTYYVVSDGGVLIACGGWSKRKTLYGGDQHKELQDNLLDPVTDSARIRAFFVHPDWARKGIGRHLIDICENAAIKNGFTSMVLGATLSGEPLYAAMGYLMVEKNQTIMPDSEVLTVITMKKYLSVGPQKK